MKLELNIIAHAHNDYNYMPRSFTMYTSEEEAAKYARPPYHTPVNIEMVKTYLEATEEQLYVYPPCYVYYDEEEGFGYYDEDKGFIKWDKENGPWDLGKWQDRPYRKRFVEVAK